MLGIISYGTYLPLWRLQRSAIAAGLRGEKAIAGFDEDSITMGVAAAIDCFNNIERKSIDGLIFASTTSPYLEKQAASIVAKALDLRRDVFTADTLACLRGGTIAMRIASDMVKAGSAKRVLVTAADCRLGAPDSIFEQDSGDGSAALVFGDSSEAIATIDVSLFDVAFFSTQCMGALLLYRVYGEIRKQVGNRGFHSYLGCFKAKDGWVFLSGTTNPIWKRLARAIGREDIANDPRFDKNDMVRFDHADLIDQVIKEWVAQRTVAEVIGVLRAARVPCGVVNTVDKLEKDPQVDAREMIVNIDYPGLGNIPIPGLPIKLSLTPANISSHAPKIGEHNKEIYCGLLGFSQKELNKLREKNII